MVVRGKERREEIGSVGWTYYTLLFLKWTTNKEGALFIVMWQAKWEGSLVENGHSYM